MNHGWLASTSSPSLASFHAQVRKNLDSDAGLVDSQLLLGLPALRLLIPMASLPLHTKPPKLAKALAQDVCCPNSHLTSSQMRTPSGIRPICRMGIRRGMFPLWVPLRGRLARTPHARRKSLSDIRPRAIGRGPGGSKGRQESFWEGEEGQQKMDEIGELREIVRERAELER